MSNRSFTITPQQRGQTVTAVLRAYLHLSWSAAKKLVEQRRVLLDGQVCPEIARRVQAGQKLLVRDLETQPRATPATRPAQPRTSPPPAKPVSTPAKPARAQQRTRPLEGRPLVRFVDDHIVIVEKPTGLTTMRHPEEAAEFGSRGQRFLPTTLADILPKLLADELASSAPVPVIPVHRIDKETSGLVVFARTPSAARHLGRQLREHTLERRYWAIVRGTAHSGSLESWLVRDRGDGRRGSGTSAGEGQFAKTHVQVREVLAGFSVVECQLETGRTHQVRIHLGEAGTPLCGEKVYDRPKHGKPYPDTSQAPRIALHAADLGLIHPVTEERLHWHSPWPDDLADLLAELRSRRE